MTRGQKVYMNEIYLRTTLLKNCTTIAQHWENDTFIQPQRYWENDARSKPPIFFPGGRRRRRLIFLGLHLSNADFGRYSDCAWRTLIFFATTDLVSAAAGGGVH